jgi:hypothetical protein
MLSTHLERGDPVSPEEATMNDRGAGSPAWGWRRVNPFKDRFELRTGARVLATLTLEGIAITSADVDVGGNRFTLTAEGVGSQRIRICNADGSVVIANFDRHWSGRTGTLRLAQGGLLEWRRVGWRRPMWEFADRFGNPLLRLRPDGSVVDCAVGDEFAHLAEPWSDALLMLSLAWFLLVIGGYALPPRLEPAVR